MHPPVGQRPQRRWLARGIRAGDRPLPGHGEAAGNDVGVFQPPFSILPAEDYGPFGNVGCGVTGGAAVTTNEYVIENIPFDMLYLCSRVGS